jgi:hypothetical protein
MAAPERFAKRQIPLAPRAVDWSAIGALAAKDAGEGWLKVANGEVK